MVHFSTDLDPAGLPATLRLMTGIVDWRTWQRRIESLRLGSNANPYWQHYLHERHGLELAFGDVRRYRMTTGRCPWPPRTPEEYRLYSFLATAVRVYPRLSERAQARFAGALRSALEKEFGLGPLAFEMKVAAHLMSRGFDVNFHDLESGGGYDFLASRDGFEAEVECKHVSADIGRQIHRRKLHDLGGALFQTKDRDGCPANSGRLLRVMLPGRLSGNKEQQQALIERIAAVVSGEAESIDDPVCAVSAEPFALQDSLFSAERGNNVTMKDIERYLSGAHGIENAHVLMNWRPGQGAVIVLVQSRKPDRVLDEMFKRLKTDAKRQFSEKLPALLCVHIADLTQQQLRELAELDRTGTGTGLQRAASILLQIRPHLHSIAVMADGDVEITRQAYNGAMSTCVQEVGPSYVFTNPEHPMAAVSPLEKVFRGRTEAA